MRKLKKQRLIFKTCHNCDYLINCKAGKARLIGVSDYELKNIGCYNYDMLATYKQLRLF